MKRAGWPEKTLLELLDGLVERLEKGLHRVDLQAREGDADVLALAAVAVKAQSGPQNYSSSLDMTIDPNTIDASERGESKPSGTSQI